MATLYDLAATKPLTYITPTPDTVTPPEVLYSLYEGYFQYFARKGFMEPANAEQVRPVLDLLPAPHTRGNEPTGGLPGTSETNPLPTRAETNTSPSSLVETRR